MSTAFLNAVASLNRRAGSSSRAWARRVARALGTGVPSVPGEGMRATSMLRSVASVRERAAPVSISNNCAPRLKTSPRMSSGAVPSTSGARKRASRTPTLFAARRTRGGRPKPRTLTSPSCETWMNSGTRKPWVSFFPWAASKAAAALLTIRRAWSAAKGWPSACERSMSAPTDRPSNISYTAKAALSSRPASKPRTACACCTCRPLFRPSTTAWATSGARSSVRKSWTCRSYPEGPS